MPEINPAMHNSEYMGRPAELVNKYLILLDLHIADLKAGVADRTLTINEFASRLFVHPRHLSNTIHQVLQSSPCALYEERLLRIAKELLIETNESIAEIARHLMYDPSNFSKFFKRYTGLTPGNFRKSIQLIQALPD